MKQLLLLFIAFLLFFAIIIALNAAYDWSLSLPLTGVIVALLWLLTVYGIREKSEKKEDEK